MWFAETEYDSRLCKIQSWMGENSIDWLLIFEPEDVTYVTGFFTEGYNMSFQAALVPAYGTPISIVCRAESFWFQSARWPDRVSWWRDGETPAAVVHRALMENIVAGRVGFDGYSWRCPYQLIAELMRTWGGGQLVDIDRSVFRFRLLKSPAEIALMKEAGLVGLMQG